MQQEPPPTPDVPLDPAPASVNAEAAPVPAAVPEQKALAVIVTLETEGNVLTPQSTLAVTVTVYAEADLPTDKATLTLTLPKGIATTAGDKHKVQWPLLALGAGQVVMQHVRLQIEKVDQALKREVGALVATVTAPSYPTIEATTLLAFAPTPPAQEDTQDATGAVIASSDGEVVLLAPVAAAPDGVLFRYSELYNWETVTPTVIASASVTVTPDTALAPVGERVLAGREPTDTLSLTALTTVTPTDSLSTDPLSTDTRPTAKLDHNLDAYRVWQLDALQDGQTLHELTGEVLVQVSVKKLVKAGLAQPA